MAEITKVGTPSLAVTLPAPNCQLSGQTAGEALGAFDAVYIKSDGKIWKATGAANNAAAQVDGWTAQSYASGDTDVTIYWDVRVRYGSGLTPGAKLYLSGTVAGGLADAASTGGTAHVAKVSADGVRVELLRSRY